MDYRTPIDISDLSVAKVGQLTTKLVSESKSGGASPEYWACRFYLLNHLVSDYCPGGVTANNEAEELWCLYELTLDQVSPLVFHYLLGIITRELRHASGFSKNEEHWGAKFPEAYEYFEAHIQGQSNPERRLHMASPDLKLGNYVEAIAWHYNHMPWSGAMGGKKWGFIAKCFLKFIRGEISVEALIDTAWTLAHNTAPIFNKGFVFRHQNTGVLQNILNTQHQGLIPTNVQQWGTVKDSLDGGTIIADVLAELTARCPNFWKPGSSVKEASKSPKKKVAAAQAQSYKVPALDLEWEIAERLSYKGASTFV